MMERWNAGATFHRLDPTAAIGQALRYWEPNIGMWPSLTLRYESYMKETNITQRIHPRPGQDKGRGRRQCPPMAQHLPTCCCHDVVPHEGCDDDWAGTDDSHSGAGTPVRVYSFRRGRFCSAATMGSSHVLCRNPCCSSRPKAR